MRKLTALVGSLFMFVSVQVLSATTIVLDFEGLADNEEVADFYNGGTGGSGSGPGPAYDITFSTGSWALIDADAGGNGNFANEPTPDTILYFLNSQSAIMNVLNGFDTGFSFFYTSITWDGTVNVYDDFNATGNLLASLDLFANGQSCGGDPSGQFNCWTPVGVLFNGIAKSVDFGGVANQIGFDDITLGSDRPGVPDVPEPSTWLLVAAGLGFVARRRIARKG